ncbi:hypothetical protein Tsp_11032 [Trichinella spiralis]|uniref:hypothetical protein n=1 Tax=Trichinella spiralis TaxID=6334 RepID=UPI0001EFB7C3|nr:hypothetical protein Tsp_11032 [Trichinella spiralis]
MISSDCKSMENVEEDGKSSETKHFRPFRKKKFIVTNRWNKCLNQIEDLLASGNRCYVTINESELKMTYNTNFSIIDAFWMNFLPKTNSKEVTYLCICGELQAKFHIERGNFYNINFPFEVENVFRTSHGLIIQRKKKSINPVNQLLPFVFSLGHPLDEFLPVIYKPLDNESARYMTSPNMLICHVSAYFSLVLAFNRATCTHSLWKLRKSTEEDRLAAAKHYEESVCSIFDTSAMSFRTPVVNLNRSQKTDSSLFHSKILHPNITHHHSALHQHLAASQANSSNQPITHSLPMVSTPMNSKLCKSTLSPGFSRLFSASSAKSVSQYFSPSTFGQTPAHKKYRKLQPSTDSNTLSDEKTKLQEESTNEIPGEVLIPDICLEKLWDETSENIRSQPKGSSPCKKAFFTRDWMGRKYICYLLAESQQLKCLRLQFEGGNLKNFSVSDSCVICNCDDACGSESMDMMLVSQCMSNIAIYSGMTKVLTEVGMNGRDIGYLDLDPSRSSIQAVDTPLSSFTSSTFLCQEVIATASTPCNSSRNVPFAGYVSTPLAGNASSIYGSTLHDYFKLPTPVSLQNNPVKSLIATSIDFIVVSLEKGVEKRESIFFYAIHVYTLKSGGIFKVKLPRLYRTKLVALCLQSLKDVLAEEVAFDMLVRWYQQNNLCSEKEELKCFCNFILRSVGLTESTSAGNLHSDTEMDVSQEETSPWETMLKLDSVQQLIEEFHFESSDLDSSRRPQSETLTVDYEAPYFIQMPNIYLALSAVYEEARLSRDIPKEIDNFLIMLSTIADALRLVDQKDRFLRNLTHIVLPERQYLIDDGKSLLLFSLENDGIRTKRLALWGRVRIVRQAPTPRFDVHAAGSRAGLLSTYDRRFGVRDAPFPGGEPTGYGLAAEGQIGGVSLGSFGLDQPWPIGLSVVRRIAKFVDDIAGRRGVADGRPVEPFASISVVVSVRNSRRRVEAVRVVANLVPPADMFRPTSERVPRRRGRCPLGQFRPRSFGYAALSLHGHRNAPRSIWSRLPQASRLEGDGALGSDSIESGLKTRPFHSRRSVAEIRLGHWTGGVSLPSGSDGMEIRHPAAADLVLRCSARQRLHGRTGPVELFQSRFVVGIFPPRCRQHSDAQVERSDAAPNHQLHPTTRTDDPLQCSNWRRIVRFGFERSARRYRRMRLSRTAGTQRSDAQRGTFVGLEREQTTYRRSRRDEKIGIARTVFEYQSGGRFEHRTDSPVG